LCRHMNRRMQKREYQIRREHCHSGHLYHRRYRQQRPEGIRETPRPRLGDLSQAAARVSSARLANIRGGLNRTRIPQESRQDALPHGNIVKMSPTVRARLETPRRPPAMSQPAATTDSTAAASSQKYAAGTNARNVGCTPTIFAGRTLRRKTRSAVVEGAAPVRNRTVAGIHSPASAVVTAARTSESPATSGREFAGPKKTGSQRALKPHIVRTGNAQVNSAAGCRRHPLTIALRSATSQRRCSRIG
jgi:hypothetical protein